MKKLRISLAVATVAVASFGAMSFSGKVKTSNPGDLIWLDQNGNEMGQRSEQAQDALCGYPKQQFCADGYEIDPVTGEPTGSPVSHIDKPL